MSWSLIFRDVLDSQVRTRTIADTVWPVDNYYFRKNIDDGASVCFTNYLHLHLKFLEITGVQLCIFLVVCSGTVSELLGFKNVLSSPIRIVK
jgi:hypothetical protein